METDTFFFCFGRPRPVFPGTEVFIDDNNSGVICTFDFLGGTFLEGRSDFPRGGKVGLPGGAGSDVIRSMSDAPGSCAILILDEGPRFGFLSQTNHKTVPLNLPYQRTTSVTRFLGRT
jgi:hypothetical protein